MKLEQSTYKNFQNLFLWIVGNMMVAVMPSGVLLAQVFNEHSVPALSAVGESTTAWGDYNKDGFLDFIIAGAKSNGDYSTDLYKNNGDGSFTLYHSFTPVADGTITWGDINRDGFLDFHLSGMTMTGEPVSELYMNNGNETFSKQVVFLEGVARSAAILTDLDNDGDLDLAYTGANDQNQNVFKYYENQQDSLVQVTISIPGFSYGSLEATDYNRDGRQDLLMTGLLEDGSKATRIYRNEGGHHFTAVDNTLPPTAFGEAAWGDYNNDGYADILLTGISKGGAFVSKVYKNEGNEIFTDATLSIKPLGNSSATWLDYDNDGWLDIFITGLEESNAENALYHNHQDGSFSLVNNTGVIKTYDGDICVTDYNQDGNLDLLVTGYNNLGAQSKLYINTLNNSNISPVPPAGLQAIAQGNSVELTWQPSSDPETTANGLSYNLRIGTFPGGADIMASHASDDGAPQILTRGNAGHSTSHWLSKLSEGRYYWAIQTIDASLKASAFSAADSFDICYPLSLGSDTILCAGEPVSLEIGKAGDQANWYSAAGIHVENQRKVEFTFYETDTLWAVLTNELGCVKQDTMIIHVNVLPSVNIGSDTVICFGETLALHTGNPGDSVNWFSASEGLLAQDTAYREYMALTADTLWAEVWNSSGCVSYDTLVISVTPLPQPDAGPDHLICRGDTTLLGNPATEKNPSLQYLWSPAVTLSDPTVARPAAFPDTTTTYVLQVTNGQGCTQFDSVTVTVNPSTILNPGKDTAICVGASVLLGGNPTATGSFLSYSYEWFPKAFLDHPYSPNPIATPDTTTTYTLLVYAGDCTADTAQVNVQVNYPPQVHLSPDVTIGFGESTQLMATGGIDYQWFPAKGLSRQDIANPYAAPRMTTIYVVEVSNEHGCSSLDTVTVYVDNRVFIPNLFSPNQDGNNDTFKVYGSGIETLNLSIYDRSGKRVYHTSHIEEAMETGWDGTVNGMPLPSGNYKWVVQGRFYDGKAVTYEGGNSGKIRLIR